MTSAITNKKSYDSVDLLKFIACFFVVALHADALLDISPLLNRLVCGGIARIAVPVFFTVSAFFFFQKELDTQSLKKYCTRLEILYGCWFAILLPKTIFDRFICSKYGMVETIFRFVRSFFVTSTFSGSWFIVSCIFCALLFYKLEQFPESRRKSLTLIISVITYVFCVITSAYGKLLEETALDGPISLYKLIFANPYNNIFTGIPYFALGRFFARGNIRFRGKRFYVVATVSCVALLLGEVLLTDSLKTAKATDCYFMLFPCIWFLFPLVLQWDIRLKNARFLRVSSTVVFFSQFIWLFAAEIAEWVFHVSIPWMLKFLFSSAAGLALSYVLQRLQRSKKFFWVKYFY